MGLSLGALSASDPSSGRIRTGEIAAGLTGAIGLATLLQYSIGWDLGIDRLLFNGSGPPRMSPTTAGSLLAMGFALLLAAREKNRTARFFGSLVGTTSLVAVLGYLYRVPALHRLPGYGSMALHTALTMLVTALGLMLLRPERLAISARNSGGVLLRRLFPAMVIALVILGWLQIEAQRAQLTDSASGISVMVVVRMVVLSGFIAWTASSLRKVENGRVAAEHALRDLNLELEDRVRARTEELAASEERFRLLAETAPVGIYRLDPHGRCTYVNRAWTTITGLSSEQAAGDGWANILHPDDSSRVLSARREATDNSLDLQLRYRIQTPGGAEKWVDSRAVAIKGNDLTVLGYVGTMIDVTAQVQAELAIASARDEALDASESKSQFLAMMSHEIRTPMNGVIGLTGLLLDTPLNATQRSYAEGVQISSEALLSIINDILDFSKIEAGKLELEDEVFDPANTVSRAASLVAQPARARGLQLVVECDPNLPVSVRGDEGRLRQILLNFATNAIKFTSIGRVTIRTYLDPEQPEEGATVRFEVIDTGPGIAEEVAGRLFQPFAQANASTTRRYGGTGLGLAICRQLATAMGGEVGLESRLGQGSTFWLRLTFAGAEPLAQTSEGSAAEPARARSLGRPAKVLVVEDHPINQQVTQAYLAHLGYTSQIVQNGLEALAALEDQSFDAVLMDCHMPDMDGYQATEELRRREGSSVHTPIIAMTASALEKDRGRCIAAGMDDYLAKPIVDGELERVLARWIPAA
jgi:PAS domain S-box-containing protein